MARKYDDEQHTADTQLPIRYLMSALIRQLQLQIEVATLRGADTMVASELAGTLYELRAQLFFSDYALELDDWTIADLMQACLPSASSAAEMAALASLGFPVREGGGTEVEDLVKAVASLSEWAAQNGPFNTHDDVEKIDQSVIGHKVTIGRDDEHAREALYMKVVQDARTNEVSDLYVVNRSVAVFAVYRPSPGRTKPRSYVIYIDDTDTRWQGSGATLLRRTFEARAEKETDEFVTHIVSYEEVTSLAESEAKRVALDRNYDA